MPAASDQMRLQKGNLAVRFFIEKICICSQPVKVAKKQCDSDQKSVKISD